MTERKVMILEDEAVVAWDIEAELLSRGVKIAGVVGQIERAFAMLAKGDVTLAILDVNVGSEKSYGVARFCQDHGIDVIFLTGDRSDEIPDQLKGITLVPKPVNYAQLMTALNRTVV